MSNPINLESKKDGLQQRQDGTWKLTLVVHGDDMQKAVDLMKAPMGQRYAVVMVAITEEDEERAWDAVKKERPKRHWNDLSRAEQAGILCEDMQFQDFLLDTLGYAVNPGDAEAAAKAVREHCSVGSRRALDRSSAASCRWDQLVSQFRQETGREAEQR